MVGPRQSLRPFAPAPPLPRLRPTTASTRAPTARSAPATRRCTCALGEGGGRGSRGVCALLGRLGASRPTLRRRCCRPFSPPPHTPPPPPPQRSALTDDDIRAEVSALQQQGHRRILALTGEHPKYTFDQFLHVRGDAFSGGRGMGHSSILGAAAVCACERLFRLHSAPPRPQRPPTQPLLPSSTPPSLRPWT